MKRIRVYGADEVKVEPFVPRVFTQNEAILSTMESLELLRARNSKRLLRKIAEKEGLIYDKEKIAFAKKMINIMVDEIANGK